MYKATFVIEHDDFGFYVYCPELPGCQSHGKTVEESIHNIHEAAELYLETLTQDERMLYLSKEILTGSVEIKVG